MAAAPATVSSPPYASNVSRAVSRDEKRWSKAVAATPQSEAPAFPCASKHCSCLQFGAYHLLCRHHRLYTINPFLHFLAVVVPCLKSTAGCARPSHSRAHLRALAQAPRNAGPCHVHKRGAADVAGAVSDADRASATICTAAVRDLRCSSAFFSAGAIGGTFSAAATAAAGARPVAASLPQQTLCQQHHRPQRRQLPHLRARTVECRVPNMVCTWSTPYL